MEGIGLASGLINSATPHLRRYSKTPSPIESRAFDSFVVLGSNAQAVEAARHFAAGGPRFLAIAGPSGIGKSHLLRAVRDQLRSEFMDCAEVMDSALWAVSSATSEASMPLILDNVQDAIGKSRVKVALTLALERRAKAGRPTLLSFTTPKSTRAVRAFLPQSKSWVVCHIQAPNSDERVKLVKEWAHRDGLFLSDSLAHILGYRMKGNNAGLLGALNRLQLQQSHWTDPGMTLRACGILNMFFSDDSSWDLRDHISGCAESFQSTLSADLRRPLAFFTMLQVAFLAEAAVADYFGVEPANAHQTAVAFERRILRQGNEREFDEALRFLRVVVASLIGH